jgi:RND family efflux transporter MFP subunit
MVGRGVRRSGNSREALLAVLLLLGASAVGSRAADAGYLGVLFARENVDVSAEVPGIVREVRVGLGDEVEAGQILVSLDSEDLHSLQEQERAALATARARADHAEAELADVERLLARRQEAPELFTVEEVQAVQTRREIARAEWEAARSTVAEREAALHELDRRLASLDVRAPFAGAVAARHSDVGVRVEAGESLIRLISAGDLWVRFAVPSSESDWLAVGRRVGVAADGSASELEAEVRKVAPEIDPATDMVFAEASLTSAEVEGADLRSGEIVRVRPHGTQ